MVLDKDSSDFLKKIGKAVETHGRKKGTKGYLKLKDVLCKEFFSSCPIDNEQRLQEMAKRQGISTGKVVLNAAKETYKRIKPQLTKKEQREAEKELNAKLTEGDNRFYTIGFMRGGGSRKEHERYYHLGVKFPLIQKPLIQGAAKRAGFSTVEFIRQAVYDKLDLIKEQVEIPTKQQREDYTTVDAVLPLRDLTEV